jgi:hypothetical protein
MNKIQSKYTDNKRGITDSSSSVVQESATTKKTDSKRGKRKELKMSKKKESPLPQSDFGRLSYRLAPEETPIISKDPGYRCFSSLE